MSIFCIIKVKISSKDKIRDLSVVTNFNLDTGDSGDSTDTGESGEPGDNEAIGVPGGAGGMESVS